jgi:hypothetical protein
VPVQIRAMIKRLRDRSASSHLARQDPSPPITPDSVCVPVRPQSRIGNGSNTPQLAYPITPHLNDVLDGAQRDNRDSMHCLVPVYYTLRENLDDTWIIRAGLEVHHAYILYLATF